MEKIRAWYCALPPHRPYCHPPEADVVQAPLAEKGPRVLSRFSPQPGQSLVVKVPSHSLSQSPPTTTTTTKQLGKSNWL